MNVEALFALLGQARLACGHRHYVVIGSLSVLGLASVASIPADMTLSIDADCYTRDDPARIFDLQAELGEGSAFHVEHGVYLDPVSPKLPSFPPGWDQRMIRVERNGVVAHFVEPNDVAVSKLARGEPRDIRWVKAGLRAGLVSLPVLMLRMRATSFLDAQESQAAFAALALATEPAKPGRRKR